MWRLPRFGSKVDLRTAVRIDRHWSGPLQDIRIDDRGRCHDLNQTPFKARDGCPGDGLAEDEKHSADRMRSS
jgi:hypothetical protein